MVGNGLTIPQRLSDTFKDGKDAVRFLVEPTDHTGNETTKSRTEAILSVGPFEGLTLWHGFSVWFPADVALKFGDTFFQWRSTPESDLAFLGLGFNDDGTLRSGSLPPFPVPRGQWLRFTVRVLHSYKGAGELELWLDGVNKGKRVALRTMGADGGYVKAGIYRSSALGRAYRYFADVRVGTTRADIEAPAAPTYEDGYRDGLADAATAIEGLRATA